MSGRHEAPPVGSAAREATASPYHGRPRADCECEHPWGWHGWGGCYSHTDAGLACPCTIEGPPRPVCDRCGMPAVQTAAGWAHAEAADAAFCALVFPRPLPPAPEFDSPGQCPSCGHPDSDCGTPHDCEHPGAGNAGSV